MWNHEKIKTKKKQDPGDQGRNKEVHERSHAKLYYFLQNVSSQLALPISEEHAQVIITSSRIASFEKTLCGPLARNLRNIDFGRKNCWRMTRHP
jgi:hypothetical protein